MAARLHHRLAVAVAVAALAWLGACRGSSHPRAQPATSAAGDEAATPGGSEDVGDVGARPKPPPCADAGVPWDGRPSGCAYEHERCCYPDAESACAAARCPAASCDVLESYPAQVRCRSTP